MLTAKGIEKAKAKADSYRMSDGRGLCLRIYPTGRKAWELRYRTVDGKQRTVDLGDFGDGEGQRGLATARSEAQRLRDLIREGGDPRELRRRATKRRRDEARRRCGIVVSARHRRQVPPARAGARTPGPPYPGPAHPRYPYS